MTFFYGIGYQPDMTGTSQDVDSIEEINLPLLDEPRLGSEHQPNLAANATVSEEDPSDTQKEFSSLAQDNTDPLASQTSSSKGSEIHTYVFKLGPPPKRHPGKNNQTRLKPNHLTTPATTSNELNKDPDLDSRTSNDDFSPTSNFEEFDFLEIPDGSTTPVDSICETGNYTSFATEEQKKNPPNTKSSEKQTLPHKELVFEKQTRLIRAILKNPDMTYKELAKLKSVSYSLSGIRETIAKMRKDYQAGTFLQKYTAFDQFSEEELEEFIKIVHPQTKTKDQWETDHLKLIQAILDNPNLPYKELAKLRSVPYAFDGLTTVISKMRKEYREDKFIKKYMAFNQFTKEELEEFIKIIRSRGKTKTQVQADRLKLIRAILDNPNLPYKKLVKLSSVPYAFDGLTTVISKMRKEYREDKFIKKYMAFNQFTKEELEEFIKIIQSRGKTQIQGKANRLKLIRAILDNPDMSYEELAKLATVPYAFDGLTTVISKMRREYQENKFIKKYMDSNQFSEEELETFIKIIDSRKRTRKPSSLKLIRAILDNPQLSYSEIAKLRSVPYRYDSIKRTISKMHKECQDGKFIKKYMAFDQFSEEELETFIKIIGSRKRSPKINRPK